LHDTYTEEHEQLVVIASGKRKKFTVHKLNPLFPASNIVEYANCVAEGRKECRLVGYRHRQSAPESFMNATAAVAVTGTARKTNSTVGLARFLTEPKRPRSKQPWHK